MAIKPEEVFTVSEINSHVKHIIEGNLSSLFVEGEIANYTHHRSGHIYFSIKDVSSTLRCVFFRNANRYLDFKPKNGDKVIIAGKLTVYEPSGQYQLNVTKMYSSGKGLLQLEFEKLKAKLLSEGLFDEEHKKPIPKFPHRVGVVTSPTGAAFQDICNVLKRRLPVEVVLYPALTQGETAPETLVKGVRFFNNFPTVELIILGRGGGSQEDLFCFNDERLAREIFNSKIPIITGIGHEIDFTIADFVSDLRAPTPSAAAELAVPDSQELIRALNDKQSRIDTVMKRELMKLRIKVSELGRKVETHNPISNLQTKQQRLDEAVLRLTYFSRRIRQKKEDIRAIEKHFMLLGQKVTQDKLKDYKYKLNDLKIRFKHDGDSIVQGYRHKISEVDTVLSSLSPQKAFDRGFAMLHKEQKVLKSISSIEIGEAVEVTLSDGSLSCTVDKKSETK